jgi:protease secretion system outer membrane protein
MRRWQQSPVGAWLARQDLGSAVRTCLVALGLQLVGPAWSLDLLQAYQKALVQDANLRAARATAEAGQEQLEQATAQLRPNIAASLARTHNNLTSSQPDFLGLPATQHQDYFSYNQTLTLRQPLYRKNLSLGVEQATYGVAEVNAVLEREIKTLSVRLATAYMEALLAQDQWQLVQTQKQAANILLHAARKTLGLGTGIRTDVDEAQARLDTVLAQELEARQHISYTRRQLELLIGEPVTTLWVVDTKALVLQEPTPNAIEDWVALALTSSSEIAALQARLDMARIEVSKAQAGHQPTLDLIAQISRSGSENVTNPSSSYANQSVGVQLTMPIYAGGYVNSTIRQAVAANTRAQELLEATRQDLAMRVRREFRGVTEAILRIKAREQSLLSAQQMLLSSQRSLKGGSRTMIDVVNAQEKTQAAEKELALARYQYLLSRIRLQSLVGGSDQTIMQQTNAWLRAGDTLPLEPHQSVK